MCIPRINTNIAAFNEVFVTSIHNHNISNVFSQAIKNGHKVWATIQTGCNQDGQTAKPITQPSEVQQRQLLHRMYDKFEVDPTAIQYIEAHGM